MFSGILVGSLVVVVVVDSVVVVEVVVTDVVHLFVVAAVSVVVGSPVVVPLYSLWRCPGLSLIKCQSFYGNKYSWTFLTC